MNTIIQRKYPSFIFSWCSILILAFNIFVQDVRGQVVVKMNLDTADIVVGQQVQLTTSVTVGNQQKVVFPHYTQKQKLVDGVEVVRQSAIDTNYLNNKQRIELKKKYTITSFDSALYTIPPFKVVVDGDTCQSATSIGLKVDWVPVDTTNVLNMRGLQGVVPPPFVWKNHLLALSCILWLIFALVIVTAVILTRRKPLVTKKIIKPQTPPFKQAMKSLNDLSNSKDKLSAKDFFVSLTDLLRVYLQRRFDVKTMEKTTSEIITALSGVTDKAVVDKLHTIFETSDYVKFAKYETSEVEMSRCLSSAKTILESTKDENMENPKPEIKIVVLNDGMQKSYRRVLWLLLSLSGIAGIAYVYYIVYQVFIIYFK